MNGSKLPRIVFECRSRFSATAHAMRGLEVTHEVGLPRGWKENARGSRLSRDEAGRLVKSPRPVFLLADLLRSIGRFFAFGAPRLRLSDVDSPRFKISPAFL